MLDNKTEYLLQIINDICVDESYKVIDISFFIDELSKKYNVKTDELKHMVTELRKSDYIDVKYSDENVYCLNILKRGRLYFQDIKISGNNVDIKKLKRVFRFYVVLSGISAFVGAALAIYLFLRS